MEISNEVKEAYLWALQDAGGWSSVSVLRDFARDTLARARQHQHDKHEHLLFRESCDGCKNTGDFSYWQSLADAELRAVRETK